MGFQNFRADNDVLLRPVTRGKEQLYEYVLVYSDDLLVVALNPSEILDKIHSSFKLKPGSVKEPDQYLGAQISKFQLDDGTYAWALSSDGYVLAAIENVERWMKKRFPDHPKMHRLKDKTSCILPSNWKPESLLKKKSNSIAYHYSREVVASGAATVMYCPTDLNAADMMTKTQPTAVRQRLAELVLY